MRIYFRRLSLGINADNATNSYLTARLLPETRLKWVAMAYIKDNFAVVKGTPGMEDLKKHPAVLYELLEFASEGMYVCRCM
jgi:hypothetical protein